MSPEVLVKKDKLQKIVMALLALLGWFALSLQLYIMLRDGPAAGIRPGASVVNFLSFFTILSNGLVAFSLTTTIIAPSTSLGRFFSDPVNRSAICLYIVIVGLIYSIALRHVWAPEGLQLWADRILHDVIPLAYLLFWRIYTPKKILKAKHIIPWLIFPLLYLTYTLVRGAVTGWYPYPFIHAGELGYSKVALNALLVMGAFGFIGITLVLVNRFMYRR